MGKRFHIKDCPCPGKPITAKLWFEKAAEKGQVDAMNNLAFLYYNGYTGTPDYAKAAEWFQKAVDAGSVEAMSNLAQLYVYGAGVDVNYNKAFELLEKAAAGGNDNAVQGISWMASQGYITADQASKWLGQ